MNSVILWFRRDLRLRDNAALEWARAEGKSIVALYIDTAAEEGQWSAGAASRWWLHHSLRTLAAELQGQNIPLHLFQGRAAQVLQQVMGETGITTVLCNVLHEPHLALRDQQLARQLEAAGGELKSFDEDNLLHPEALLNQQGTPYKVFTPFWKRLRTTLAELPQRWPGDASTRFPKAAPLHPAKALTLDTLGLCDDHPWQQKLHAHWQPGEASAWQRVDDFLEAIIADYPKGRDLPAIDGTSRLSPHLHFGEITARQLLRELLPLLDGPAALATGVEEWLRQLGWREFARYILWHFPHTAEQPMDQRFGNHFWQMDEALFDSWKRGHTGEPIIDAGMQQLWQSGWMHNRVRMLVASYLTKNLCLPWQEGARWFWETLVDADLANNAMGWQWVAGCGVDASPYFRIFNPRTQAERFDPQGRYAGQWLEKETPAEPLVDLKRSREQALEHYNREIRQRRTV